MLYSITPKRWLSDFLHILFKGRYKEPWFQAAFCLFIMTTQFVAIEGLGGISMVKVVYMCLTPLFMLCMGRRLNQGVLIMMLGGYFGSICISAFVFQNGVFKVTSICYMLLYVLTFCYYLSLLYSGAFTYEFFLKLVRGMILGYFYILILQQVTACLHVDPLFRIFNCHGFPWGWKFPCMNLEPSHASRVIIALMISFVELLHIREPSARSLHYLWMHHKDIVIAFTYSELTNGGTSGQIAFLVMGMYLLYHSKRLAFLLGLIAIGLLIFLMKDTVAFHRLSVSLEAAATLDREIVHQADSSAAARINIYLSTIQTMNPFDYGFWVGNGFNSDVYGIGILLYYGAIVYIMQLVFLFKYAFRRLFDIEVVVYGLFLWFTIGNVAHAWAMVMWWSAVKYFEIQSKKEKVYTTVKAQGEDRQRKCFLPVSRMSCE